MACDSNIKIREVRAGDAKAIIEIFRSSVRFVARRDYTQAQVVAWAPGGQASLYAIFSTPVEKTVSGSGIRRSYARKRTLTDDGSGSTRVGWGARYRRRAVAGLFC
jgi:hypothetical protein